MSIEELRAEVARLKARLEEQSYARDYLEICQLTSYYTHIYHMLKDDECPALFAQRVPDVSIEVYDHGVYEGLENVRKFFKAMAVNAQRPGWLQQHLAVNPVIQISKDRDRAKGLWHSPGIMSRFREGELTAYWNWQKYDIDYIREDGSWKFHKIVARLTFQSPYHKGWVEESVAPSSGSLAGMTPTKPTTYHMPYDPNRINVFQPEPPKPFQE